MQKKPLHGDSIARMIQFAAADVGLELDPSQDSGDGKQDLRALIARCYNAHLKTEVFAEAIADLNKAADKGDLPESARAIITMAVLAANAAYEDQKKK